MPLSNTCGNCCYPRTITYYDALTIDKMLKERDSLASPDKEAVAFAEFLRLNYQISDEMYFHKDDQEGDSQATSEQLYTIFKQK